MRLSKDELIMLSRLLDTALELPAEAREPWLERLAEPFSALRPRLRELLSQQASAETNDFLDTLPKFTVASGETDQAAHAASVREGQIVGVYRLVREIGHGGMSTVWLATRTDGLIKRPVALKLPHRHLHLHAQFADRFARERDILAALTHPNIARLYDAGISPEGQPYLAVEYVEGLSLIDYCDSHRLTIGDRVAAFLQVLAAVQYAHAHLVIHRDLKPSNILVMATGHVQLLDFGIAKLLTDGEAKETALTQIGGRALTPDYASPEQIVGQPLSIASDVYSLGVVLFELLSGSRPYQLKRNSRGALEQAILEADPRNPSESLAVSHAAACAVSDRSLARTLKGDLDTIVLKALQKDPHARYSTADAFAGDIHRYQRGEPLFAKPGGLWYRGGKFLRRYRLAAASGAAIFAALAVGLGIALWQADRATQQALRAETEARTANSVERFLQNIFLANSDHQSDPIKMRQMTARQLLDIGAKKIDTSLDDAPVAKLRLLKTLGDLYFQLDLNDDAVALQRKQLAVAKRLYGPHDVRVAAALVDLSSAMSASHSSNEQGAVLEEALAILDGQGDHTSRLRGNLMKELADWYDARDRTASLTYAQESVRLLRPFGPSTDLAEALIMEGESHTGLNQYSAAAALLSEALAVSKAADGDPNPQLPRINAYLGEARYFEGRWQQSELSYRDGLRAALTFGGSEDIYTIQTESRLGQFLCLTSRFKEGLTLLKAARDSVLKTANPDDVWNVPMMLELYAESLRKYGDLEPALTDMSTAAAMYHKYQIGTAAELPALESSIAVLTIMGRLAEAAEILKQSESIRATLEDESTNLNADVIVRSDWLIASGRPIEALKILDRFTVKPAETGVSLTALQLSIQTARVHLARNDASSVIAELTPTRDQIAGSPLRPYLKGYEGDTLLLIGKAKLMMGQGAAAQPELVRALSLFVELYNAERSPDVADAEVALAKSLATDGHLNEARVLAQRAKRIQATHPALGFQYRRPLRDLERVLSTSQTGTIVRTSD
jgi:serine/threonine protein kinase